MCPSSSHSASKPNECDCSDAKLAPSLSDSSGESHVTGPRLRGGESQGGDGEVGRRCRRDGGRYVCRRVLLCLARRRKMQAGWNKASVCVQQ
jgi:hypothetical protein